MKFISLSHLSVVMLQGEKKSRRALACSQVKLCRLCPMMVSTISGRSFDSELCDFSPTQAIKVLYKPKEIALIEIAYRSHNWS